MRSLRGMLLLWPVQAPLRRARRYNRKRTLNADSLVS
jgi:hypothetical protein